MLFVPLPSFVGTSVGNSFSTNLCALRVFVGTKFPFLVENPFVLFVSSWENLIYNLAGNPFVPFVSLPSFVGTSVGNPFSTNLCALRVFVGEFNL